MQIGNKIKQLRKLSGMTQEQLAEKLNVSRQTVSKWESGGSAPDIESIVKVSKIFQLSLDDLLQEGETVVTDKNDERITLEDLVKINLHNRRMTLLTPSVIAGVTGLALCICYAVKNSRKKR